MMTRRKIELEQSGLKDLSEIVEIYEELAALKMKKVRDGVVKGRPFLTGLSEVFSEIRAERDKEVQLKMAHNGKTAVVLISSNVGLYGDIIHKTMGKFREFVTEHKADVVVLGRLGEAWFENFKKDFKYFEALDDTVDKKMLMDLMKYLLKYEKVILFHGQFLSLMEQEPVQTDLIGKLKILKKEDSKVRYIYEPSLDEVVRVFKEELLYSMFEQVLWESNLAKFASRVVHLDGAKDNIDERYEVISQMKKNMALRESNKKQLTRLAGVLI